MKCAVDTMILIWFFDCRKSNEPDEEFNRFRYRANVLFDVLSEKKAEIVIPTVSLSELMVPMSDVEREHFLAKATKDFFCPVLDAEAASIAARLMKDYGTFKEEDRYKKRAILKADILIMATAKAAGAVEFYSHDKAARNLASKVMKSSDLPTRHENFAVDQDLRDRFKIK